MYVFKLFKQQFNVPLLQIASITSSGSIASFMTDFEVSDYAFVGDIYQVYNTNYSCIKHLY